MLVPDRAGNLFNGRSSRRRQLPQDHRRIAVQIQGANIPQQYTVLFELVPSFYHIIVVGVFDSRPNRSSIDAHFP